MDKEDCENPWNYKKKRGGKAISSMLAGSSGGMKRGERKRQSQVKVGIKGKKKRQI